MWGGKKRKREKEKKRKRRKHQSWKQWFLDAKNEVIFSQFHLQSNKFDIPIICTSRKGWVKIIKKKREEKRDIFSVLFSSLFLLFIDKTYTQTFKLWINIEWSWKMLFKLDDSENCFEIKKWEVEMREHRISK